MNLTSSFGHTFVCYPREIPTFDALSIKDKNGLRLFSFDWIFSKERIPFGSIGELSASMLCTLKPVPGFIFGVCADELNPVVRVSNLIDDRILRKWRAFH